MPRAPAELGLCKRRQSPARGSGWLSINYQLSTIHISKNCWDSTRAVEEILFPGNKKSILCDFLRRMFNQPNVGRAMHVNQMFNHR